MTTLALTLLLFLQDPLEVAQKALDAKDYPAAIKTLGTYIAGHPEDYRALFNLAYAYTLNGDRQAAVTTYEKTLGVSPQLFQARLNLATLLIEENRHRDALPHLAAAVEAKPDHLRAVLLYGDALWRTGDRVRAWAQFQKALTLEPNVAAAHMGLARIAIDEKNYAEAEKEITRSLELQPADQGMRLELARVFELGGNTAAAITTYKESLQTPAVHRRLGNLYMDQKKFPEAAAEFEQAGDADWDLARVYSAMKQPDKALPHLARLRQTSPTNFDVLLMLGQTLIIKKDYPAAQSALLEAIRVQPQTPDPYVDLANVFYLQERYPETLQALDRLAGLGPGKVHETPWSAFLRAITLDKLGVVQPALDSYKRFLSISTGQYPDQEFQARQRVKVLTLLLEKGMKHRK